MTHALALAVLLLCGIARAEAPKAPAPEASVAEIDLLRIKLANAQLALAQRVLVEAQGVVRDAVIQLRTKYRMAESDQIDDEGRIHRAPAPAAKPEPVQKPSK